MTEDFLNLIDKIKKFNNIPINDEIMNQNIHITKSEPDPFDASIIDIETCDLQRLDNLLNIIEKIQ